MDETHPQQHRAVGRDNPHEHDENALSVEREVAAPADAVWSVLADGWSYATWVVGTARVRAVDDGWPSVGTQIHHSVGVWPLLLNDSTSALESCAPERLVLEARGWPLGKAHVTVEVRPRRARSCVVTHPRGRGGRARHPGAPSR